MASRPPTPTDTPIPTLIAAAERGDASAAGALFATLYAELHRLASKQLARSPAGFALNTTTLLHEAYLDISGRDGLKFPDRGHFMAYAARAMRGLLVDYVRERKAQKRGGRFEITSLDNHEAASPTEGEAVERLSAALDELADVEPELAQVVELKFFCGFSFGEIATMKGLSERTVQRHWDKARIYLHGAFHDAGVL
ncbi:MAG: ECF-type sigma factor [Polyangiaceae bacterium]|jgi:RNA polymerase sigma factor (TIGR02999 family)|nr:ECF-type sigma factor [Polyangiaceae bacterium]